MLGSKTTTNALIVGHVTGDRYDGAIVPGGPAYYGARTMAGLGARVSLHTVSGFAPGEVFPDPPAETTGMGVPGARTTIFHNTYDERGALSQRVGGRCAHGVAPIGRGGLPLGPPPPGPRHRRDRRRRLAGRCERSDLVGLGLQGFFRRPGTSEAGGLRTVDADPEAVVELPLERITALFLSEEDLGALGTEELLEVLVARTPAVFLTRGAKGCRVFFNGSVHQVPAFETEAVDPTGAGDTFAAGTTLALATGRHPVEAARLGSAAASVAVEGRGGERSLQDEPGLEPPRAPE